MFSCTRIPLENKVDQENELFSNLTFNLLTGIPHRIVSANLLGERQNERQYLYFIYLSSKHNLHEIYIKSTKK